MSDKKEEGGYSEDAALLFNHMKLQNLRGTGKFNSCPGHVEIVALPCGHDLPQDYLIAWCRYLLNQRKKSEFTCPICSAGFSYQSIAAKLTPHQVEFFEERLGALTAAKLCDYKPCPGCKSFVERADRKNLCVRCTICTANMGRTYDFCWNCRRKWKGPMPSSVRCDNSGCGTELTSQTTTLKLCEPKFKMLKSQTEQIYPMKEKSSGRMRLALIINNIEFLKKEDYRQGAEKDEESMRILLEGLGYEVIILNNLSLRGMDCALRDFSQRNEHKSSDSTFVVMMSHGGPKGIYGVYYDETEKDVFPVANIFHHLNSENCENLIDKPKIILIQACRGEDEGCVWARDGGRSVGVKRHTEKDFGCLRSCTPDTVSWRKIKDGSVFIQSLANIFSEHAHENDVMELFRKVAYCFEEKAKEEDIYQMPCLERTTLVKKFYLFPGI